MYSLPSFPLVANELLQIYLCDPSSVPKATGNPVKAVVLQNTSGFTLLVSGVGDTVTIPPGMNDLVKMPSPSPAAQITIAVTGSNQNVTLPPTLGGMVYEVNDPLPTNSYPMVNPSYLAAVSLNPFQVITSKAQSGAAPVVTSLVGLIPNCITVLGFIQITAGSADLTITTNLNAGAIIQFVKAGADHGFTLWRIPPLPDLNNITVTPAGAGDSWSLVLYALQQATDDINSILPPFAQPLFAPAAFATATFATGPSFAVHGGKGILVVTSGLNQPFFGALQTYQGGGNWTTVGASSVGNVFQAVQSPEFKVPPGTSRITLFNDSGATAAATAEFIQ